MPPGLHPVSAGAHGVRPSVSARKIVRLFRVGSCAEKQGFEALRAHAVRPCGLLREAGDDKTTRCFCLLFPVS